MKPEKYISLELAKEIAEVAKDKGVELPKSQYIWNTHEVGSEQPFLEEYRGDRNGEIEAYDCQELGEILPRPIYIDSQRKGLWNLAVRIKDEWEKEQGMTEPEVRGKMLLYLLKNDLLK